MTVIAADFDGSAAIREEAAAAQQAQNAARPVFGQQQVNMPQGTPSAAEKSAKDQAEANHRAGVKAADNPTYYDDIFNIFKSK